MIEDNGIGRSRSKEIKDKKMTNRRSYGIKLTEDRLRSYEQSNGGKALLDFEDLTDEDGSSSGTKVRMVLPVISPATSNRV